VEQPAEEPWDAAWLPEWVSAGDIVELTEANEPLAEPAPTVVAEAEPEAELGAEPEVEPDPESEAELDTEPEAELDEPGPAHDEHLPEVTVEEPVAGEAEIEDVEVPEVEVPEPVTEWLSTAPLAAWDLPLPAEDADDAPTVGSASEAPAPVRAPVRAPAAASRGRAKVLLPSAVLLIAALLAGFSVTGNSDGDRAAVAAVERDADESAAPTTGRTPAAATRAGQPVGPLAGVVPVEVTSGAPTENAPSASASTTSRTARTARTAKTARTAQAPAAGTPAADVPASVIPSITATPDSGSLAGPGPDRTVGTTTDSTESIETDLPPDVSSTPTSSAPTSSTPTSSAPTSPPTATPTDGSVDCPAGDGDTGANPGDTGANPGDTGGGAGDVAGACGVTATTGGAPDGTGGVPPSTGDAGSTVDGQQG
jgi:hypothetical protein